jgi:hypothetical protein
VSIKYKITHKWKWLCIVNCKRWSTNLLSRSFRSYFISFPFLHLFMSSFISKFTYSLLQTQNFQHLLGMQGSHLPVFVWK